MSGKFGKKRKANKGKHRNEPPQKRQKINNNNKNKKKSNKNLYPWKSPKNCISWLLNDKNNKVSNDQFFKEYFGIKPLLIKRNQVNYYSQQQLKLELSDINQIIKDNELRFGQHIIAKV